MDMVRILVLVSSFITVAVSTPVVSSISGLINKPVYSKTNENQELYGIYGAHNITIKKANYVGSISSRSTGKLIGGVIVIDQFWVLTAAYNFYGLKEEDVIVRLGSSSSQDKGQLFNVQKIIKHPQYMHLFDYNIALLKLNMPIKFHNTVGKISIATYVPKEGTKVAVSGFGFVENRSRGFLKQAILPVVSYDTCRKKYGIVEGFTKRSFCTSGKAPCMYDFGDPLVYQKRLIGVFAGTYDCSGVSYPAVYADATQYRYWIQNTIKENTDHV